MIRLEKDTKQNIFYSLKTRYNWKANLRRIRNRLCLDSIQLNFLIAKQRNLEPVTRVWPFNRTHVRHKITN